MSDAGGVRFVVGRVVGVVVVKLAILLTGFFVGFGLGRMLLADVDGLAAGACGVIALGLFGIGWGVRGLYMESQS